jgi:hypothetical protein
MQIWQYPAANVGHFQQFDRFFVLSFSKKLNFLMTTTGFSVPLTISRIF